MKKARAIQLKKDKTLKIAVLMTAPIVIALVYFFSAANAWGLEGDHRLKRNPGAQGWEQIKYSEPKADEKRDLQEDGTEIAQ